MMPPHAVGGRPAFQAGGEGSNPSGGTTYPVVCICENPEWIDDAGDGWQYCANCKELARSIDEETASSANGLGSQTLNLETLGSNPLEATNPVEATNPFEHIPLEVGARGLDAYIAALRAIDPQKRKALTTCVIWIGAGSKPPSHGGVIRRHNRHGVPVSLKPSKYVWQIVNGALVPEGMVVGHICNNFMCINPEHLLVGTRAAIYLMFSAQGRYKKIAAERTATHCKRGHAIQGSNLVKWKQSKGDRVISRCRLCSQRYSREGNRRRNGAVPRSKRKHPDMSNPEQLCGRKLHFFTKKNTLVYWNKTRKEWYKNCRECSNKRTRTRKRRDFGFTPSIRYKFERSV